MVPVSVGIMNTVATVSLFASLAVSATALGDEKWIQLFNGKDLEGWTMKFKDVPVGENHHNIFRVEDGLLKVRSSTM